MQVKDILNSIKKLFAKTKDTRMAKFAITRWSNSTQQRWFKCATIQKNTEITYI